MPQGLWLVVLVAPMLVGCARHEVMRYDNPLAFSSADAPTVQQVTRSVLQNLRFVIEVPPANENQITTEPITGASWFEFWREDTIGVFQHVESSLHTVRRRVSVTVAPGEHGGASVAIKVTKERMSAPDIGPNTIAQTFSIYDLEHSELARFDETDPQYFQWVEMGRDDRLEQRILERIQATLMASRTR
jgi:hypothetical protein